MGFLQPNYEGDKHAYGLNGDADWMISTEVLPRLLNVWNLKYNWLDKLV